MQANINNLYQILIELYKFIPKFIPKFILGKDLATTPGKIVLRNKIMELICFMPVKPKIFKFPILLIPSCINKYYILDLSKHNSLVNYLINKGFIVYVISWFNPQNKSHNLKFNDYIFKGIIKAIDIITIKHMHLKLHVAGYCLGGTLLSCAIAYLEQIKDRRIISVTNFMTLLDFTNLGKLGFFITKPIIKFINLLMQAQGFFDGRLLNIFFNWLKPHDFFKLRNNLEDHDFMYWNADPMNLPKDFYRFYLENICFANKLANPNHLILNKIQINLKKIKLPIFCVAGSKDHIAAWQSVYKGARLYGGNIKFILADAGHVKGLINPQFKINYFKNNKLTIDPKTWLKNAKKYSGSWWGSWINWLNKINNQKVSANRMLQILDQYKLGEAPGKYIL